MSAPLLFLACGAVVFAFGMYGLFVRVHVLRKIMAANIAAGGAFLVLVAGATGRGGPDPVPHALVLTGIVIALAITAFALALLQALHARSRDEGRGS